MKHIKEYISEGLFDDEDDLLDRRLSTASLEWFLDRNNVIFPDENSENLNINDKGELIMQMSYSIPRPYSGIININLLNPIPDWIKFDKNNWDKFVRFNIMYPVKSQKDLPTAGNIQYLSGNLNNLNINAHSYNTGPIVIYKSKINGPINIIQSENLRDHNYISIIDTPLNLKNIKYIKSIGSDYARLNIINSSGPLKKLFNDLIGKKAIRDEFTANNQDLLRTLRSNGIYYIYSNPKISIAIESLYEGNMVIIPDQLNNYAIQNALQNAQIPYELR